MNNNQIGQKNTTFSDPKRRPTATLFDDKGNESRVTLIGRHFLSDRIHRYGIYLAVLFQIIGLITILLSFFRLPPVIPLFYHRPWGVAQLGEPRQLFLLSTVSIFVFCCNMLLAATVYRSAALLSRILVWSSVLIACISSITIIRIVLLMLTV